MPNTHSTLTSLFSDIADAIRAKTGSSATIVADDFPTAIANIPTGGGGITTTEVANATGTTLEITSSGGGGGATEYVCPSRNVVGVEDCFYLSDIGLSASDFLNDSHTIMWVEWTSDEDYVTVWLDSDDDDEFCITIPSGTKAVCSSCSNGIATFAFCGLANNAYGFFTLQATDYPYDSISDSTSSVTGLGGSADSPLKSAAVQSATYGNRNNGFLDAAFAFGNASLHILKF